MLGRARTAATAALLIGLATAVWWLGPDPGSLRPAVRHPQSYVDRVGADQAALTAVCVLCWAVLAWLAIGLAFAAAGALPGIAGRICDATADRLLPAALRRTAAVAVGLSVATAGSGAAIAMWQPGAHPGTTTSLAVDWPTTTGIDPDWPVHTEHPKTRQRQHVATHKTDPVVVVVRPGDCLWDIAAAHLGPGATAAEIARAWPRWYAANRAVIGPDPNLIHPGQRLVPPT
jgi:nucleoid-associated protein YgaU